MSYIPHIHAQVIVPVPERPKPKVIQPTAIREKIEETKKIKGGLKPLKKEVRCDRLCL